MLFAPKEPKNEGGQVLVEIAVALVIISMIIVAVTVGLNYACQHGMISSC